MRFTVAFFIKSKKRRHELPFLPRKITTNSSQSRDFFENRFMVCTYSALDESKAPVSQLLNAEVNSVVVIAVLAPNHTLQVRICECHA